MSKNTQTIPAVTTTTYTCDRCGKTSDRSDFGGNEWGEAAVRHYGRGYDGGTGARDLNWDLCGPCLYAVEECVIGGQSAPSTKAVKALNEISPEQWNQLAAVCGLPEFKGLSEVFDLLLIARTAVQKA